MDWLKVLRYKFVRYCVNKAYGDVLSLGDEIREVYTKISNLTTSEAVRVLENVDPAVAELFRDKAIQLCGQEEGDCVQKVCRELEQLPVDVINIFDDVVNQIRNLERGFTSLESAERVFREVAGRIRFLKEREPALAKFFVNKLVDYCLEMEEVANSPVGKRVEELREVVL